MTNTELFFERYENDEALRQRVEEALAVYPGSLELRAYETRKKLQNRKEDVPIEEDEPLEDPIEYWLLDRGWEWDDTPVRRRDALLRDIERGYSS